MKKEETLMIDKHFIDWESHVFGYGYGTGEQIILPSLKNFFGSLKEGRSYDYETLEKLLGDCATWLLINTLCHADIIEYGTSPRYGWLTKKGEALKKYFDGKTPDELYELLMGRRMDDVQCFPDLCQCDTPCNNPMFC